MSFLDKLFLTAVASAIKTPTTQIDVSSSEPALNKILKITSMSPPRGTWEDDAGGPISSVFGRSGAVTAALNDYLASLVGNNSAVSGATVKDALETLAAAVVTAAKRTGNPYIDPPASPNAFDDEFDGGSADLATRGWTIKRMSDGVTLTRNGEVTPWTNPPAGKYNSSIAGSTLLVQSESQFAIYKTGLTVATGDVFFARVGSPFLLNATGDARFQDTGLYHLTGGKPDNDQRVTVTNYETAAGMNVLMVRRQNPGPSELNAFRSGLMNFDIRGVYCDPSGSGYAPFVTDSANGQTFKWSVASTSVLDTFAVLMDPGSAGDSSPRILSIDYIRRKTAGWIVP